MAGFAELFQEAGREVLSVQFLVEFFQGCLLIAAIAFFVPRLLGPGIAARAQRVKTELDAAETADAERAKAGREAKRIVSAARRESKSALTQACGEVEAERSGALSAADQEAAEIVAVARRTIEAEKAAVVAQVCDETVVLVTVVARRYLREVLSDAERRDLTEKVVLSSLERMDTLQVE